MCNNHEDFMPQLARESITATFRDADAYAREVYRALIAMCRSRRMVSDRAMDAAHEVYLEWMSRPVDDEKDPRYHAFYMSKSVGSVLGGKLHRSKFGPMVCSPDVVDPYESKPHFNTDGKLIDDANGSRRYEYKHSHEDYVIAALDLAYRKDDRTRWRRALAKLYDEGWTSVQIAAELRVKVRRVTMWRGGVGAPLLRREDIIALALDQPSPERRYQGTAKEYTAMRRGAYERCQAQREAVGLEEERKTELRFAHDKWHGALLRLLKAGWSKTAISEQVLVLPEGVTEWKSGQREPKPEVQAAILKLDALHQADVLAPRAHASRRLDVKGAKVLRERGMSWREIGRRLGCSGKGIQLAVEGPRPKRAGGSKLDVEAAKAMREEGLSWVQIGKRLGCSDAGIKLAVERVSLAEVG